MVLDSVFEKKGFVCLYGACGGGTSPLHRAIGRKRLIQLLVADLWLRARSR